MSAAQREKGARGERELANLLSRALGVLFLRNLEAPRGGGQDLIAAPSGNGPESPRIGRYAIEVKRCAKVAPHMLREWWGQACSQAEPSGRVPLLAYRPDRGAWRFVLPMVEICSDLPNSLDFRHTADISLDLFLELAQENIL